MDSPKTSQRSLRGSITAMQGCAERLAELLPHARKAVCAILGPEKELAKLNSVEPKPQSNCLIEELEETRERIHKQIDELNMLIGLLEEAT